MGEMADVVLNSTRVLPKNLLASGFGFEYPELVPALEDLIRKGI
jgi:NAD dependent epimerase/dehydratase family enzyme